jgi:phosphatidylglycerophosphatase A
MLWSTLFTAAAWLPMLVAFGLFRLFDVLKPFPANIIDRSSKTSPSWMRRGIYIVFDDVVAGIYTALILQALVAYVFPRFGAA